MEDILELYMFSVVRLYNVSHGWIHEPAYKCIDSTIPFPLPS